MIVLKTRMLSQLFASILGALQIKFLLKRKRSNFTNSAMKAICFFQAKYIRMLSGIIKTLKALIKSVIVPATIS